jgi:citrate/tricarballylate utilization protein
MQQLEALVRQAQAEVSRQMQICNACRYCEGFCAVFPAMTRRLAFTAADADYLANLCHNCGACLYACQYAPPHEFAVNVPKAMAVVRRETYASHAWPRAFGALYRRNGTFAAVALAAALAAFLVLALAWRGTLMHPPLAGDFYAVFPHNFMAGVFGAVFLYVMVALALGVRSFWRTISPAADPSAGAAPPSVVRTGAAHAAHDAFTLKYLDGGHGDGCNNESDRYTMWRRRWHHCTFYGFLLCFASTCVATIYHYAMGWHAPYPLASLPVVLGTLGGIGLLAGPLGLLAMSSVRNPEQGDMSQRPMDRAFVGLLFLTSVTGLLLLALRDTRGMAALLAVHLGVVMALFITLPYGKFAHAVFRGAALLKWEIERRLPSRVRVGSD